MILKNLKNVKTQPSLLSSAFWFLTLVYLFSANGTVFAKVAESPLRLGILDWQQLLVKAPQAEEAGKRLDKEFQPRKDRLIAKQKELQIKMDKWQKDKEIMNDTERNKTDKTLTKAQLEIRRLDEEFRADYSARHREEMDEFLKLVKETVEKMAVQEKYDLILPQDVVFYSSDKIDITETVFDALKTKEPQDQKDQTNK